MSDRTRIQAYDDGAPSVPDVSQHFPPLPTWLVERVLRPEETITWTYGPRHQPLWERYITHPGLFLVALLLGAACLGIGVLSVNRLSEMPVLSVLSAGFFVFGSVFVLALSNAYFTRLVVTNRRLLVLQGYETCRSWSLDDLPPSLIRYGRMRDGGEDRTVDLGALKSMLGGASDQFVEAKTIMAFSKQIERMNGRRKDDRS